MNIGASFVSLSVRALIAYGVYSSIILPTVIHGTGIMFSLFYIFGCVVYLSIDMKNDKEVLGGSILDIQTVENRTIGHYIMNCITIPLDVAILFFLVGSPMVSAVYGLSAISFMIFVFEHQKAIFKINEKGKNLNEQTNSMHR